MTRLILILSIFYVLSGCSENRPHPGADIPESLLVRPVQPVLTGTRKQDLWRLIARQKAVIATVSTQLDGIACIDAFRSALINDTELPDCGDISQI